MRAWLGKKRDPETVAKITKTRNATMLVRQLPPPSKETLEIWLQNMKAANAKRSKPVQCLDDGMVFPNIKSASRHYGIGPSYLSRHCNGKHKSAKGMKFKFVVQS